MEGGRVSREGSENGVFSGRMERKLGGNQVWKWKGTRGLGEIAFDRISRLEKEPSLPQLSANEISRDTICLFESLFPACTRSRAYARIRCKRLVQRTTDLIGFRTRFANSSVYRFNGSFSSISGKALDMLVDAVPRSKVSYRDEIPLVWSYRRIPPRAFDRALDRGTAVIIYCR